MVSKDNDLIVARLKAQLLKDGRIINVEQCQVELSGRKDKAFFSHFLRKKQLTGGLKT